MSLLRAQSSSSINSQTAVACMVLVSAQSSSSVNSQTALACMVVVRAQSYVSDFIELRLIHLQYPVQALLNTKSSSSINSQTALAWGGTGVTPVAEDPSPCTTMDAKATDDEETAWTEVSE